MTPAEIARAMGKYIRKHGFSPEYTVLGTDCGCFWHAACVVGDDIPQRVMAMHVLADVTGTNWFSERELRAAGWVKDRSATLDAAAACEIAADLLTPSPL